MVAHLFATYVPKTELKKACALNAELKRQHREMSRQLTAVRIKINTVHGNLATLKKAHNALEGATATAAAAAATAAGEAVSLDGVGGGETRIV